MLGCFKLHCMLPMLEPRPAERQAMMLFLPDHKAPRGSGPGIFFDLGITQKTNTRQNNVSTVSITLSDQCEGPLVVRAASHGPMLGSWMLDSVGAWFLVPEYKRVLGKDCTCSGEAPTRSPRGSGSRECVQGC